MIRRRRRGATGRGDRSVIGDHSAKLTLHQIAGWIGRPDPAIEPPMDFNARKRLYRQIEAERKTKVIAFATSDRQGAETQIAQDCIILFVELLDKFGPVPKISLVLHTNGGQTSAAWRIVNLMRTFADDFEVIVPFKALSAGTLISLGATREICAPA
jgi:ATP-dependent protease ClpP protease subunit